MKVEICENCEREIDLCEQAFVHNGRILCEKCYTIERARKKWKAKILMLIGLIPILIFIAVYTVYSIYTFSQLTSPSPALPPIRHALQQIYLVTYLVVTIPLTIYALALIRKSLRIARMMSTAWWVIWLVGCIFMAINVLSPRVPGRQYEDFVVLVQFTLFYGLVWAFLGLGIRGLTRIVEDENQSGEDKLSEEAQD